VTVDLVSALADLIDMQTTPLVPNVLARAAMEAGSQAWWLLEPGIGARRRVIRSMLIRAASARELKTAVRKVDRTLRISDFGEDPDMVRQCAARLGLTYICNDRTTECESERLPGFTKRADDFGEANRMTAAYRIYSASVHVQWYAVVQDWRDVDKAETSTPMRERRPDREAAWAAVIASAGFAVMPAWRAMTLLGLNARLMELREHVRMLDNLLRRMDLPKSWR
jgi:hypothetical protein